MSPDTRTNKHICLCMATQMLLDSSLGLCSCIAIGCNYTSSLLPSLPPSLPLSSSFPPALLSSLLPTLANALVVLPFIGPPGIQFDLFPPSLPPFFPLPSQCSGSDP